MKKIASRPRTWMSAALLAVLTASTGACVADSDMPVDEELVGTDEQELFVSGLTITRQSLVFDACSAFLTIRFRTLSGPLSFIALDTTLASDLGLELVTFGPSGAITPIAGVTALPIDTALLASVRTRLALAATSAGVFLDSTSFLSTTQLSAMAGFLDASTQADLLLLVGGTGTIASTTLLFPAMQLALNPAITGTTLIFPGLSTIGVTSIGVRASFAAEAFALSRVSVFAATSSGLLRRRVFDVPFLSSSCLGLLPPIISPGLPPLFPVIPPVFPPLVPPVFPPTPPLACGLGTCDAGEFCCNPSCGICAPLGGVCIQIACE